MRNVPLRRGEEVLSCPAPVPVRTTDNGFIVDGLLALHDEAARRRTATPRAPAAGSPVAQPSAQDPVPDHEKGWEF